MTIKGCGSDEGGMYGDSRFRMCDGRQQEKKRVK